MSAFGGKADIFGGKAAIGCRLEMMLRGHLNFGGQRPRNSCARKDPRHANVAHGLHLRANVPHSNNSGHCGPGAVCPLMTQSGHCAHRLPSLIQVKPGSPLTA